MGFSYLYSQLIILLTSFTLMALELSLMRFFSIYQWHIWTSIIVIASLLGFGTSGIAVNFLKNKISTQFSKYLYILLAFYPISLVLSFVLSSLLPITPKGGGLDQAAYFGLAVLLMLVPFLLGYLIIVMVFLVPLPFPSFYPRLFSLHFLGSALGLAFALLLSYYYDPTVIIAIAVGISFISLILTATDFNRLIQTFSLTLALSVTFLLLHSFKTLDLKEPAPYKEISAALNAKNTKMTLEKFSADDLLQIVTQYAPLAKGENEKVPIKKSIFFDGNHPSPIIPFDGDFTQVQYLDNTISAFPYSILSDGNKSNVLLLRLGGGADILLSLMNGFDQVHGVEPNGSLIDTMWYTENLFSGGIYSHPKLHIYVQSVREFLRTTKKKYNLVVLNLVNNTGSVTIPGSLSHIDYTLTVEFLKDCVKCLTNDGFLSIELSDPYKQSLGLKLFEMMNIALKDMGLEASKEHLLLIRRDDSLVWLLKKSPITLFENQKAKLFSTNNGFVLAFHHLKDSSVYSNLVENNSFAPTTEYTPEKRSRHIQPAFDDKPFFHNDQIDIIYHFLVNYGVSDLLSIPWKDGKLLIIYGLVFLFSFMLIFASFFFPGKSKLALLRDYSSVAYFFFVAGAFTLAKLLFIDKLTLLLPFNISPQWILITFLASAGLGSFFSQQLSSKNSWLISFITLILISLLSFVGLDQLLYQLLDIDSNIKMLSVASVLVPFGLFAGVLFPMGYNALKERSTDLIPMVWSIMGFSMLFITLAANLFTGIFGLSFAFLIGSGLIFLAALSYWISFIRTK